MSGRLQIDVFFDFICPWCLIGKRQLERAQQLLRRQQPDVQIVTQWHGVQLLPQLPATGLPFAEFYRQRLGSAEAVRMRQAQVRQAAMAVGVAIDLEGITTMPNTADAHRLLARAEALGDSARRDALLERLFAGYFQLGENLGCPQTLLAIASACGYPASELADCLTGDARAFIGKEQGASQGVPAFQFNARLTVVGAQPAEALLGAMDEALRSQCVEQPV
ncbi:DsbA family oxidoreductase [Pseudomonas sp. NFIX28]|uniref:DsbA family oxidoreductase n=1 Tax=Pseudomonas sp. NFIX28 TaxID=1566235 RepID=UPI000895A16D|nr:DsbA family oxidoreductase [Pseudomonas sp. NFIX28]SDZ61963.1 Predicted dithiol-disulfide isomerase, DsbA family [Pseudomonas sp. NFIX28]